MNRLRDTLTYWICNFMINRVATPEYGKKLSAVISQGLMHAELGGPLILKRDSDNG